MEIESPIMRTRGNPGLSETVLSGLSIANAGTCPRRTRERIKARGKDRMRHDAVCIVRIYGIEPPWTSAESDG